MVYLICAIAFAFASAGIILLLGLTPERIARDISRLLAPAMSLRERALTAQKRRKKSVLIKEIILIGTALDSEGNRSGFGTACLASIILMMSGAVLAVFLGNLWLLPVSVAAGAALPFLFAVGSIEAYDRRMDTELETALSIITSTYIRTEDIVGSVSANLTNIRPPVSGMFGKFVARASLVSSDIPGCLRSLREGSENRVFKEWCDTLIACQEDSSNRFVLMPIVTKLTEIRLVNSEMNTVIAGCRREYWSMVMILIGNIPLLRMINKDWFGILFTTLPGKLTVAFCAAVIVVTSFLMIKITKPIRY